MHPHVLSGTFSIRELVAEWSDTDHSATHNLPILLDISSFRHEIRIHADNWYLAQSQHVLRLHPELQPYWWETISIPTVSIREISVPEISLPHIEGPSKETLNTLFSISSRFAYGVSLASLLFFLGPIVILESQQTLKDLQNHLGKNKVYSAPLEPVFTQTPEPYASSPSDVFSIRVPDLDIESVIIPNVDTTDKDSYSPALKEGIAHAAGSGFPGENEHNKTIYLFAHSTDATWNIAQYNAQFYALKDAEIGQKIDIRYWNNDTTYRITEKRIIAADDVSALAPQTEKEQLILQTCYPPGTTWKRLLIIAIPESEYTDIENDIDESSDLETSYNKNIVDIDNPVISTYNTQTV